jgi:hypothetical protein
MTMFHCLGIFCQVPMFCLQCSGLHLWCAIIIILDQNVVYFMYE